MPRMRMVADPGGSVSNPVVVAWIQVATTLPGARSASTGGDDKMAKEEGPGLTSGLWWHEMRTMTTMGGGFRWQRLKSSGNSIDSGGGGSPQCWLGLHVW